MIRAEPQNIPSLFDWTVRVRLRLLLKLLATEQGAYRNASK